MADKLKKYELTGCCGIDCGLCPRYHTKGNSACPGCGGLHFKDKHPACGYLTCCAVKKGLEVCSECHDYPCKRFDPEKEGYDSFVTHRMVFKNLSFIKDNGIEAFTEGQRIKVDILNYLLTHLDDGRSKHFYCLACALLPADRLQEVHALALRQDKELGLKEKIYRIKNFIITIADSMKIELKLNNRTKPKE